MKLKYGVLGAGHLGKIHLRCINTSEKIDLVGFYDPDTTNAAKVAAELNTTAFDSPESLIAACDVVDIVTPTTMHYALAEKVALAGKHIFIEKPLTHTVEEAEKLLDIVAKMGIKVQVGHVERFNPAFLTVRDMSIAPLFVEAHRLSPFNPRGTDVSVVLDLMIHDIDLVLHVVNAPIKNIMANGVSVVSNTPDIANARIEFENGCVANLTASRLSLKAMRKVRFFQSDAYISLDFLDKKAQIVRLYDDASQSENTNLLPLDTPKGQRWIDVQMPDTEQVNAIQMELESLAESIENNTTPRVSIEAGYNALKVAHRIVEAIGDSTLS